jgi:hypothetical protein
MINKAVTFYVLLIFVQLFGGINYAMSEEYYLIATDNGSNYMEVFSLRKDVFKLHKKIEFPMISNFQWPNYNHVTHDLYFEGLSEDARHRGSFIYKYNTDNNPKTEQLLEGRYPALSPDGKLLTYYRHPNHLVLFETKSKLIKEIGDDIDNCRPPVWVSNKRLLYYNVKKQMILFDISTGKKQMTGYEKIIPGSLSPDGRTVLCGNYAGNKIILYFIDDNKIETIKESNFLTIGTTFIWSPDGRSFLYARQKWSSVLRLREGHSLFLFSLVDRTEKDLDSGIPLAGGVVWPD